MFKSSFKKLVLAVALIVVLATVLTACAPTPTYDGKLTPPSSTEVKNNSNGGVAVEVGDYIYYVNGYQSSYTSSPNYVEPAKLGDIVRVKKSDIDYVFDSILTKDGDHAQNARDYLLGGKVELVVSDFFYSGYAMSTTSSVNPGLYVFGKYLYYTTPSQSVNTSGYTLNNQLVLKRYDLSTSDASKTEALYTFTANNLAIKLVEVNSTVYAMYVQDGNLYCLDLSKANKEPAKISESVTNATFEDNSVYYLADGKITAFTAGQSSAKALKVEEPKDSNVTYAYTIDSVSNGYVYYTYKPTPSEYSATDGLVLYYTNASDDNGIAFYSTKSDIKPTYFYNKKGIKVVSVSSNGITGYGIVMYNDNQAGSRSEVYPVGGTTSSITLNKLEGNYLYYTIDSVMYKKDLTNLSSEAVAVSYSLGTSASGWTIPEMVGNYSFTVTSSAVTIKKFDSTAKANQKRVGTTTEVSVNIFWKAE